MTPFEYIESMRQTLKSPIAQPDNTITLEEHRNSMLNMLDMIESNLKDAEYEYVVENSKTEETLTLENYFVQFKYLNKEIILMQPVLGSPDDIMILNLDELVSVLRDLKESGKIKQEILLIPPFMNVFKAKLANKKHEVHTYCNCCGTEFTTTQDNIVCPQCGCEYSEENEFIEIYGS